MLLKFDGRGDFDFFDVKSRGEKRRKSRILAGLRRFRKKISDFSEGRFETFPILLPSSTRANKFPVAAVRFNENDPRVGETVRSKSIEQTTRSVRKTKRNKRNVGLLQDDVCRVVLNRFQNRRAPAAFF